MCSAEAAEEGQNEAELGAVGAQDRFKWRAATGRLVSPGPCIRLVVPKLESSKCS